MRIAAFTAALALLPALAAAQGQTDPSTLTCAAFVALPVDEQVMALSTLEPFGDDMNASDLDASKQWAEAVTAACRGKPDRPLPDAAREAMGD